MTFIAELVDDVRAGRRRVVEVVHGESHVTVKFADGAEIEASARQAQELARAADQTPASGDGWNELLDALG